MAVYNAWVVEYYDGSAWTAIPKVQDLSCQVGRQTAVDQWPVSQASMRIWYPNGYTTPLANLTIGTYIRFFAPGRSSTKPSWTGLVQNVTVEVGIPWNSGTSTGNGDFLVIDCEGFQAEIGRRNEIGMPSASGQSIADFINYAFYQMSVDNDPSYYISGWSWYSASSTVNPGEAVQMIATLTLGRPCDGVRNTGAGWQGGAVNDPGLYFGRGAQAATTTTVAFSDTANSSSARIYDQITFDGLADTYLTQSQLSYEVPGSSFTFTGSSATSPVRTFVGTIVPAAGAPAALWAQYSADWWANAFNPADIGISSISATTAGQHTQNLDTLGVTDLELGYLPLYIVPVTLRGTTYYVQIEGVSITADTNQTRFTYYVTPTDTTAWFTLDSSTFGVLDQNRLGIY